MSKLNSGERFGQRRFPRSTCAHAPLPLEGPRTARVDEAHMRHATPGARLFLD
jgi:hypothetical protein